MGWAQPTTLLGQTVTGVASGTRAHWPWLIHLPAVGPRIRGKIFISL